MASQQRTTQKSSNRWNWMQQAVASVESRLDNILGEEDEPPRKPSPAPSTARPVAMNPAVKRESMEAARSGASPPANDRLQSRLAQAMAKKASSRSESPVPDQHQTKIATTNATLNPSHTVVDARDPLRETNNAGAVEMSQVPASSNPTVANEDTTPTSLGRSLAQQSSSGRSSAESVQVDYQDMVSQPEREDAKRQANEEINDYIERIDALQAKLKYLATEAIHAAKQAMSSVQDGSLEKKLLEKDEKIALLMQEGQTLSKTELKHLQTIKKIKQQYMAATKDHDATRNRAEKAERSLQVMEDRALRAESATKRAEQQVASSMTISDEFELLKKEKDALNATLAEVKTQLSRANARAEAAENAAVAEQLRKERQKNIEIQDELTSLKVERELADEKLQQQIKDLNALLDQEKEHCRVMETEMLAEQATLESKLESFRARAEEASSSSQGGAQAKLLRQIETLQNQYGAASQNWQGIESSLLTRITTLEKERDDIAARESDLRRKLRESTLKAKKTEKDVEEAHGKLSELERLRVEAEEEVFRSNRRIRELEDKLKKAHTDVEEQRSQAEKDLQRRLEEERSKWVASLPPPRIDSPAVSLRKASGLGFDLTSPLERPTSRRQSHLPGDDSFTPPRQHSLVSLKGLSNGGVTETPSLVTSNDADEYFNVLSGPQSQSHAASPRAVHDLVSTSTVAAGPSVQLVERMSANVRRLESEKAAAKDEHLRLLTQRDEARKEVVALMREIEQKRGIEERLKSLENEHKDLVERHQTTLELLGEKSELVDELKADIADVKQMYRQLADTMGQT